uniref:Uncharacterized protein n=1 Tax=Strigamia maritima TaxID=126957 RepID=T1IZM1_STRMM
MSFDICTYGNNVAESHWFLSATEKHDVTL